MVSEVHYLGTETRYHVDTGAGFTRVIRRQNPEYDTVPLGIGQQVTANWSAGSATILH